MDYQNQSSLRFSLEESIWFEEGQEVAELLTLSIDPDVYISEQNQYIVIDGFLQVSGEYRGIQLQLEEEADLDDELNDEENYVHNVAQRAEDGLYLFNHRFPVNISIPANRVDNRETIEVEVSNLDYNLPENRCIKLSAELLITGIYGEVMEREEDIVESQEEIEESMPFYTPIEYEYEDQARLDEKIEEPQETEEMEPFLSIRQDDFESFSAEAFAVPREDDVQERKMNEMPLPQDFQQSPLSDSQPNFSMPIPTFPTTLNDFSYDEEQEGSPEIPMAADEKVEESKKEAVLTREEKEEGPIPVVNQAEEESIRVEEESAKEAVLTREEKEEVPIPIVNRAKEESIRVEEESAKEAVLTREEKEEVPIPVVNQAEEESIRVEEESAKEAVLTREEKEEVPIPIVNRAKEESIHVEEESVYDEPPTVEVRQEEYEEEAVEESTESIPEVIYLNESNRKVYTSENQETEKEREPAKAFISLTDFFGKKESQSHSRLKVCIVQNGESLADVATRYSVNQLDLLSYNDLDSGNDVYEGQVLYIPSKTIHK
ncbi:MAG: LysM peptidoglycan-binding domain-containing protein [Bacillus sp. (in: firmicutes)]